MSEYEEKIPLKGMAIVVLAGALPIAASQMDFSGEGIATLQKPDNASSASGQEEIKDKEAKQKNLPIAKLEINEVASSKQYRYDPGCVDTVNKVFTPLSQHCDGVINEYDWKE